MRLASRLLLACVFAALLLGADVPIPIVDHAGTEADPDIVYNTVTVGMAFDDMYTSAGVVIARIDADVLTETGVPLASFYWTTGWTITDGVIRVPIRVEATTLANGVYRLKVRVWDTYGNVSYYADEYWVSKQWRAIEKPRGCALVP